MLSAANTLPVISPTTSPVNVSPWDTIELVPVSSEKSTLPLTNAPPFHFKTWFAAVDVVTTSLSSLMLWLVKSMFTSARLPGSYLPRVALYINACPSVGDVLPTLASVSIVVGIVGLPVNELYCPSNNVGRLSRSV